MLAHWYTARAIKAMAVWALIPHQVVAVFWETWHQAYQD